MSKKKAPRAAIPVHIQLGSRPTIVRAVELHRVLSAQLASGKPVIVDGTLVEEIDTAILQLLASLWRTGAERGIACAWHGASQVLRKTASLIGVAEFLHLPDGDSAQPP